jgi:hypothetical protein
MSHPFLLLFVALTLASLGPAAGKAAGQFSGFPQVDQRIRVWSVEHGLRGAEARIAGASVDTLELELGQGNELRVATTELERIDLAVREKSAGEGARRGMYVGALTLGGLGVLSGFVVNHLRAGACADDCGQWHVVLGAAGATAGALGGLIIGASSPGTVWRRIPNRER